MNLNGFVQKDKVQQEKELIAKAMYPKREEFQWRPAPILCKRFDLADPYMGKVVCLYGFAIFCPCLFQSIVCLAPWCAMHCDN